VVDERAVRADSSQRANVGRRGGRRDAGPGRILENLPARAGAAGLVGCHPARLVRADRRVGGLDRPGRLHQQPRDDRDNVGLAACGALYGTDRPGDLHPLLQEAGAWTALLPRRSLLRWGCRWGLTTSASMFSASPSARPGAAVSQIQKDTTSVRPGEREDMIWTAREPGKWLIHCHIPHHTTNDNVEEQGGGGLTMVIDVTP